MTADAARVFLHHLSGSGRKIACRAESSRRYGKGPVGTNRPKDLRGKKAPEGELMRMFELVNSGYRSNGGVGAGMT